MMHTLNDFKKDKIYVFSRNMPINDMYRVIGMKNLNKIVTSATQGEMCIVRVKR